MDTLNSYESSYKTAKDFKSYDDQYYYGSSYYSYLKNNAHKEELLKRFGIKQMPKFTPSTLLLNTYKRFKNTYEHFDKDSESKEIRYKLELEDANKKFEPQFQKLRDEYKSGSRNKRTINKEYNELLQQYSYYTNGNKYSIPLFEENQEAKKEPLKQKKKKNPPKTPIIYYIPEPVKEPMKTRKVYNPRVKNIII